MQIWSFRLYADFPDRNACFGSVSQSIAATDTQEPSIFKMSSLAASVFLLIQVSFKGHTLLHLKIFCSSKQKAKKLTANRQLLRAQCTLLV